MKSLLLSHDAGLHTAALRGEKTNTFRFSSALEKINKDPNRWEVKKYGDSHYDILMKGTNHLYDTVRARYQPGEVIYIGEPFIDLEPLELSRHAGCRYLYKYDQPFDPLLQEVEKQAFEKGASWVSKMNMPAAAARHYLQITDVKLFRLHEIKRRDAINGGIKAEPMPEKSLEDLLREGTVKHVSIKPNASEEVRRGLDRVILHASRSRKPIYYNYLEGTYTCHPVESYMTLWVSLYGLDSWNLNPWVFAYYFKLATKPSDGQL